MQLAKIKIFLNANNIINLQKSVVNEKLNKIVKKNYFHQCLSSFLSILLNLYFDMIFSYYGYYNPNAN